MASFGAENIRVLSKNLRKIFCEHYFDSVAEPPAACQVKVMPLVKEMTNVIMMRKGEDERKLYTDHLAKKYTK